MKAAVKVAERAVSMAEWKASLRVVKTAVVRVVVSVAHLVL